MLLPEEEYERLSHYDTGPWTDEERDLLRAEAVEALGWEGMEAYQDDEVVVVVRGELAAFEPASPRFVKSGSDEKSQPL